MGYSIKPKLNGQNNYCIGDSSCLPFYVYGMLDLSQRQWY